MGRNAKITREFYGAYNRRDWEALAAFLGPDVSWFHAARRENIQGPDAVLALLRSSAEAFPDARIELHAVHEAGATAIAEWIYVSGRARKPKRAIVCDVVEILDGKIARGTTYGDTLQMLLELGEGATSTPIPAAPAAPVIRFVDA